MSDYPRMMYHDDGRAAVVQSAYEETREFGPGSGWSRTAGETHRRDPGDAIVHTLVPVLAQAPVGVPGPRLLATDAAGPVSAGDVRAIIREEMAAHPGFGSHDFASRDEVASIADKLDLLLQQLGVEAPAQESTAPRRGRPPGSRNKSPTEQE